MSDTPAATPPSRTERLLTLVRALIGRGRQLADTLYQRTPTTDLSTITWVFGSLDIALIPTRITRGLQRAAALEAWLMARPDRPPPTRRTSATRPPCGTQAADGPTPPRPTPLSADDFAAEVRRRPIGAVLADICRDLGILPSDELWLELSDAILVHRGNLIALFKQIEARLWLLRPPESMLRLLPVRGTGPP